MKPRPELGASAAVRSALILLLLLPWLPRLFERWSLLAPLGALLDVWFELHCHREPARTLDLLAVCWRCYGIYFGLGAGALTVRPQLTSFAYRVWVVCAALVIAVDVSTEVLGMRPPFGPLRFFSGTLLGWPVGVALVLALRTSRAAARADQ